MSNVISFVILITAATLAAWSAARARRAHNHLIRWGGASLAGRTASVTLVIQEPAT